MQNFKPRQYDINLNEVIRKIKTGNVPTDVRTRDVCIDVGNTNLNDDGVKEIINALQSTPLVGALRVNFSFTNITEQSVKLIAELMKKKKCTYINVTHTSIGVEGAKALADVIESCPNNCFLALSGRLIKGEAEKVLANALKSANCPEYFTLHIGYTSFSEEAEAALVEALKKNITLNVEGNFDNSELRALLERNKLIKKYPEFADYIKAVCHAANLYEPKILATEMNWLQQVIPVEVEEFVEKINR